jgi:hypothetical protein
MKHSKWSHGGVNQRVREVLDGVLAQVWKNQSGTWHSKVSLHDPQNMGERQRIEFIDATYHHTELAAKQAATRMATVLIGIVKGDCK